MSKIISGYTDGKDYVIACAVVETYAKDHGWSASKKKPTSGVRFDYEFSMSRNGAKDSNSPAVSLVVSYVGGGKAIELKRHGQWTAVLGLNKDGGLSSGQWQGETGIDDLVELRDLYMRVRGQDE